MKSDTENPINPDLDEPVVREPKIRTPKGLEQLVSSTEPIPDAAGYDLPAFDAPDPNTVAVRPLVDTADNQSASVTDQTKRFGPLSTDTDIDLDETTVMPAVEATPDSAVLLDESAVDDLQPAEADASAEPADARQARPAGGRVKPLRAGLPTGHGSVADQRRGGARVYKLVGYTTIAKINRKYQAENQQRLLRRFLAIIITILLIVLLFAIYNPFRNLGELRRALGMDQPYATHERTTDETGATAGAATGPEAAVTVQPEPEP